MRQPEGLRQKKSLGQVFLKVDWPVERIVEQLKEAGAVRVLEIGPGGGVLTRPLLAAGFDVTAVEKDDRFAAQLKEAGHERLTIINEDILRFDLEGWLATSGAPTAIAGNIPYNISSPIVLKAVPFLPKVLCMTLMTQLEFAERVAAEPHTKDYGSLSVYVQLRAATSLDFEVPRDCFQPVPKVDSAVMTLKALAEAHPQALLDRTETITRAAFSQRRKKLRNGIRQFLVEAGADEKSFPIDLERRADTLTPSEFLQLGTLLSRSRKT